MTFKNKIKEHSKTRPENWGIASLKLSLKLEMEEGDACMWENMTRKEPLWDATFVSEKAHFLKIAVKKC